MAQTTPARPAKRRPGTPGALSLWLQRKSDRQCPVVRLAPATAGE